MQEKLVSFDTAKLAKEKGFNWKTDYYYRSNSKVYVPLYYDPTPNNLTITEDWMSGDTENGPIKVCTAPTQSLLQQWLREVHNIHIDLGWIPKNSCEIEPFDVLWWYLVGFIGRSSDNDVKEDFADYHNYEEALEIALQEALKLI